MRHRLHNLLIANKGKGSFEVVENKADDSATLYIYDAIVSDDYYGGVSAETFVKALNDLKASTINIRINSPGGDVFAARAIEQAIKAHPSKVISYVDGYAASAASYVAIAADEVNIAEGAFFMIHKAWTIAFGNSDELLATADLLDKIDESLVSTYAARTNKDPEAIKQMMKDETWIGASEAVDMGMADKISETKAKNSQNWDLSAYANAESAKISEPTPEKGNKIVDNTDDLNRRRQDLEHRNREFALL